MTCIYLPVGLPGCGKTTYAEEILFNNNIKHVCADYIRQELAPGVAYDPKLNEEVFNIYYWRMTYYLSRDVSVVADATNVNTKQRKKIYEYGRMFNSPIHVIIFNNIKEAKERNNARTGLVSGNMKVPEESMNRMEKQFQQSLYDIETEPWTTLTVIESFQTKINK